MEEEAIILHGSRSGLEWRRYKDEGLGQKKENHRDAWSSSEEWLGVFAETQELGAGGIGAIGTF